MSLHNQQNAIFCQQFVFEILEYDARILAMAANNTHQQDGKS